MDNKLDKKISAMLNEEIYIPQKISNRIKISLEKKRKGIWLNIKFSKIVTTIALLLIVGTGVVFASKVIIDRIKSIDIAKEYGYFEKVDVDYIIDSGIGVKIEDYFIDKGRVGVTINIKPEETFGNNKEIKEIEAYSTELRESNTYTEEIDGKFYVHFDESEQGLEYNERFNLIQFFDENGKEVKFDEDSIGGRGPEYGQCEYLDDDTVKFLYTKPIYQEVKAEKMKITIKRLSIYTQTEKKEYIGNWEFEIDISDRYKNKSDVIKYNGTVNLESIKIEKAELSATKLIVTVKTEDLRKLLYGEDGKGEILYGHPRLFGEEGEYNQEDINSEQSNYYDKNEIVFKFDISKFSSENSYKIVLDGGMVITLYK